MPALSLHSTQRHSYHVRRTSARSNLQVKKFLEISLEQLYEEHLDERLFLLSIRPLALSIFLRIYLLCLSLAFVELKSLVVVAADGRLLELTVGIRIVRDAGDCGELRVRARHHHRHRY